MKSLTQYIKESLIPDLINPRDLVNLYNDMVCCRRPITESSANRLIKWLTECDCAFITAFREKLKDIVHDDKTWFGKDGKWKKNHTFTHEENRERNKALKAELLSAGYGVIKVKGIYPEGMSKESAEESYVVINLNNDPGFYEWIFDRSEFYNQDSFFYKPKDSETGYLVGTNGYDYPGYGEHGPASRFMLGHASNYMSRLGNKAFAFIPDGAIKNSSRKEAMEQIETERKAKISKQHYWRDMDQTSFHNRKQTRKEQFESFVERFSNEEILIMEDIHPKSQLCIGYFLDEQNLR